MASSESTDLVSSASMEASGAYGSAGAARAGDVGGHGMDVEPRRGDGKQPWWKVLTNQALLAVVVFLGVGVSWFMGWCQWPFSRSLYFIAVTLTTVGYGDFVPLDKPSKIFVGLYVICAISSIAAFLSVLVESVIERQSAVISRVLQHENVEAGMQALRVKTGYYRHAIATLGWFLGVVAAGVVFFVVDQKMDMIDAIYLTIISSSTVGFGDLTIKPVPRAELFVSVWLVLSTIGLAKVVGDFTDAYATKKQDEYVRAVLTASLRSGSDFHRIDADKDGMVDRYEYLIAMLERTEKVSRPEIGEIMRKFDEVDVDNSGLIEKSEIGLV